MRPSERARPALLALAAVALAAWCGWVSGFHRRTTPALATWVVSLTAVVAVNVLLWLGRQERRPGRRLPPVAERWPRPAAAGRHPAVVGTAPWLALALVACAWDVLALDTGPRRSHLTISALAQGYRPLNAALLLVWMLVGAGYGIARGRAPKAAGDPRPAAALVVPPALLLPSDPPLGIGFWLGIAAAAVALDALARRTGGRIANAGEILRFVTQAPAANAVIVLAWAYAGYHLFAY